MRLHFRADALRSLSGWILLKYMLNQCDLTLGPIGRNPFGKPLFAVPNAPCFNISHSASLVSCVLDDGAVGVDLQAVQAIEDIEMVLSQCLTAGELDHLNGVEEPLRTELFYRYWTCKEATLKCLGSSITAICRFSVVIENETEAHAWRCGRRYYIKSFHHFPGYQFAVCSPRRIQEDVTVIPFANLLATACN